MNKFDYYWWVRQDLFEDTTNTENMSPNSGSQSDLEGETTSLWIDPIHTDHYLNDAYYNNVSTMSSARCSNEESSMVLYTYINRDLETGMTNSENSTIIVKLSSDANQADLDTNYSTSRDFIVTTFSMVNTP